jgi:hypothetical protein
LVRSSDNRRAIQAVVAIGRAYAHLPRMDFGRSIEAAHKLDAVLADYKSGEAVVALTVLLLRGLGVTDWQDISRWQS